MSRQARAAAMALRQRQQQHSSSSSSTTTTTTTTAHSRVAGGRTEGVRLTALSSSSRAISFWKVVAL